MKTASVTFWGFIIFWFICQKEVFLATLSFKYFDTFYNKFMTTLIYSYIITAIVLLFI